jgi:3-hydroxyacyl-[acyl-carrier-protein] dehydratase
MNFLDNLFITQSITNTEDGFEAVVRCNPEHAVYKSHFPGNPITPGACMLQEAGVLMQEKIGRPLFLKTSKNIKYLSLLIPAEGKEVKYVFSRIVESETECKTQVVIADETTVYTKMSLTYSYEPL